MAFFVDMARNRIVAAAIDAPREPTWKVVDGETAAACDLSEGLDVTGEQISALLDGSPSRFRATLSGEARASLESISAVGPPTVRLRSATYLGSHPTYPKTVEHVDIELSDTGLRLSAYGEPWKLIEYGQLHELSAGTSESVESRVTATRVALLGVLALVAKKTTLTSYLTAVDADGEWMFSVPNVSAGELRAWAAPGSRRVMRERPAPLPAPLPSPSSQGATTFAERLARLDELFAGGAITADEHASRREAILNEL